MEIFQFELKLRNQCHKERYWVIRCSVYLFMIYKNDIVMDVLLYNMLMTVWYLPHFYLRLDFLTDCKIH